MGRTLAEMLQGLNEWPTAFVTTVQDSVCVCAVILDERQRLSRTAAP